MLDSAKKNKFNQQSRDKPSLIFLVLILGVLSAVGVGIMVADLIRDLRPKVFATPGIYKTLNYQGKLQDLDGITVPDAAYNIKFAIYNAAAAGNVLWSARESDACGAPFNPSAKSVTTSVGVFSTLLGESGDCPITLDFNDDAYYLGITVGSDAEMTPRKRIGAAGYAFNADLLDGVSEEFFARLAQNETVTGSWTFGDANTDAVIFTAYINSDLYVGANAETIANDGFTMTGAGAGYFADQLGVEGSVFTDTSFIVGASTIYDNGSITTTGTTDLTLNPAGGDVSITDDNFSVDTNVLYVDAVTNNNIGIGTAAPDADRALDLTTSKKYGIYAETSAAINNTAAVFGSVTDITNISKYGGYFTAAGTSGRGVFGEASGAGDALIPNYGGYFTAAGDSGQGVYGDASATGAVTNYGGYFTAAGDNGRGIQADAGGTGQNYGGYFNASGTVAGTAGVMATAWGAANNVYGVYGYARNPGAYTNYGGYFQAAGQTGRGVYGEASATAATVNYGGYFTAAGTAPGTSGVYGLASGAAAVYGVYGEASGTGALVLNYGGYFKAAGDMARVVYAESTSTGGSGYGVFSVTSGLTGIAVYGQATAIVGASNVGGSFEAGGDTGAIGVRGASSAGTGTNYGVYGSAVSGYSVYGFSGGTAWAGYFEGSRGLHADRLAVNDVSSIAYNTIGTAAASHTAAGEIEDASDLFIADDLEVNGAAWFDGGHTDLAEMVAYDGEGEAGDVVVIDENNDNSAKIATKPYDQSVLGIISTKPSLIITGDIKEGKLLAMAGRVPTKVTNINGAIKRGDLLTTSSVPGHAMKATEPGPIVGKALGECDESDCNIWVFLNVSWYGGVRTEAATTVSPTTEDAPDLDRDSILDKVTDFWKKLFR